MEAWWIVIVIVKKKIQPSGQKEAKKRGFDMTQRREGGFSSLEDLRNGVRTMANISPIDYNINPLLKF